MENKGIYENSKVKLIFTVAAVWGVITIAIILAVFGLRDVALEKIDILKDIWNTAYIGILAYMGLNITNNILHAAIKKPEDK